MRAWQGLQIDAIYMEMSVEEAEALRKITSEWCIKHMWDGPEEEDRRWEVARALTESVLTKILG